MKFYRADLSAEYVRSVLRYNRTTGLFYWKNSLRKGVHPGDVAGCVRVGRRSIGIKGHRYPASRLAWLYVNGSWPSHEIDHRNLNRGDDRWSNLRLATHAQNLRNVGLKSNNTSGIKGVSWDLDRRKWIAMITVDGRQKNLGRFVSLKAAKSQYRIAAAQLHGEFCRVA